MAPWWPFAKEGGSDASNSYGGGASDDTIGSIPNAADTTVFAIRKTGEGRNYGGEERGLAVRQVDRALDTQAVMRKGDARLGAMDVDSMESLMQRYEEEFKTASAAIEERKLQAQRKLINFYDYQGDRRYHEWQKDQQSVREKLQIHWLDLLIDRPMTCLVYLARVCTTAGFFYGVGRSVYLYRSMDKLYAKLNGVTFGTIAFTEITTSVARSAGVAVAGTAGVVIGDTAANLFDTVWSGSVSAPDRTWQHIVSSGFFSGLLGGGALAVMHSNVYTPWGLKFVVGGFTGIGTAAGLYLGYAIYRPFAATRTHRLYDPYWRPWFMRRMNPTGPTNVRGKYS